ncbi:MAG: hypothetical protein IT449_11010 [Phycisphaerales bacterium]|nr:hypothetical protein [Phycisphaerales bacterium]
MQTLMLVTMLLHFYGAHPQAQTPAEPPAEKQAKPPAQAVLDDILRGRQGPTLVPPTSAVATSLKKKLQLLPDGSHLANRVGRLNKDGDDWRFVFEGDETQASIILLPNQMLERMIQRSVSSQAPLVFLVSGQVTEFMGDNYLLTTVALERSESPNLRK